MNSIPKINWGSFRGRSVSFRGLYRSSFQDLSVIGSSSLLGTSVKTIRHHADVIKCRFTSRCGCFGFSTHRQFLADSYLPWKVVGISVRFSSAFLKSKRSDQPQPLIVSPMTYIKNQTGDAKSATISRRCTFNK